MKALIAVLPGDGIGREVTDSALAIGEAIEQKYSHDFNFIQARIGGTAIDADGDPLPRATEELCQRADAVLLGAVGGPKWSNPAAKLRPEQGLLRLRKAMGLFANLRPVRPYPALYGASPLKPERLHGVDIVVVRELTGGIYFGDKHRDDDSATDVCTYSRAEIERITRVAADLAASRSGRLVSVDKANVLETSRLWRETVTALIETDYPGIELSHLLVDAAAMHLLDRAATFDVIVTENMFGDILTDEASMLAGSLGLLPSASLGLDRRGLYEPIHGSAPDIAGQGKANPCATIASFAMLLRHSLNLEEEADAVERALQVAIDAGARTADIAASGETVLTTGQMTQEILNAL